MTQKEITFATGNAAKFRSASLICKQFDIKLHQATLEINEIQAEDATVIARDKAQKAYELVGSPTVVNDDSWIIPGLNGFPGPYMKSMNDWLTPEDFLRLTEPLTDRRVILAQYTVYQDKHGQQLFRRDIEGVLLPEIRGEYPDSPNMSIISFDDGKTSAAELLAKQLPVIDDYRTTWHDLGEWLTKDKL
jgi:XTP/dITP diphosphohydrolase